MTSCARTPAWNRGHSQGDHPRRRRDVTSVRCGVPYSRLRAAAVRSDGCRRREGGPRLPRPHTRPEDNLRHAVCAAGVSRSVRRDAIQRDALLARPDVGRRSDDHGPRHRTVPSTYHRRGRASRGSSRRWPSTDYQFRVCVESVEICQTDGHQIVFTADG